MVSCSPKSKTPQRPACLLPDFSVYFQNSSLRWATARRVPVDGHGDPITSPSCFPTSSSPPPPQTKNSPTPPSNRRNLVHRPPSHPHSKNSKQEDEPPVPTTPPTLPSQDACKMISLRTRDSVGKGKTAATKGKASVEFSITLTAEEIKRDFIAMTGSKPPRRPKRRRWSVQEDVNVRPLLVLFRISFFLLLRIITADLGSSCRQSCLGCNCPRL